MPILENYNLWIKEARLSFPNVLQARSQNNGPPKFNANFIVDQNSQEWAEAMQLVGQVAQDKWQQHAQNILNMIQGDKRLRCYGSGNEKVSQQTGEIYEGFKEPGVCWLSASSANPPQLRNAANEEVNAMTGANTLFVGGNYVSGLIRLWPQENEHGRAIRAELVGIQYLREGEHFGADEMNAADVFAAVPGAPPTTAPAPGMPAAAPAPAPTVSPAAPAPAIDDFL